MTRQALLALALLANFVQASEREARVGDRVQGVADPTIVGVVKSVRGNPTFVLVQLDRPQTKTHQVEDPSTADLRLRISRAESELRHYEQRSRIPQQEAGWILAKGELDVLNKQLDARLKALRVAEAVWEVEVPADKVRVVNVNWRI